VLIEKKAKEFNVQCNKLGIADAIRSHYQFLKVMGNFHDKDSEDPEDECMAQVRMSVISKL